ITVHQIEWLGESFQLDLVGSKLHQEILPGDVVEGGLRIRHSLIGEHATVIQVYVLRLACTNGLTYRECVSRRAARTRRLPIGHPGAHDLELAQVWRLASDAWSGLREKLDALRALPGEELHVPQVLRSWILRAHLSTRRLLPLLMQAWHTEGGRDNAFDALNALTRVATHATSLSLRERRALAALAGVLGFRAIHSCPRCFAPLRAPLPGDETTQEEVEAIVRENHLSARMTPRTEATQGAEFDGRSGT
ncbi:MAG: hypothetical protein M1423_07420, partial [Acidobacteria bacterium]|nr:hypothetical protein [Acidobacteriota bacterium]